MHRNNTAPVIHHGPLWSTDAELPTHAPLLESIDTDVCIVGAGIAGLSTAYFLARAGKRVAVVDKGRLCEGMTQFTTAHLASALDVRYTDLERTHGAEGARLAARSHTAAIDQIESIVNSESIDCGFCRVDGYLFLGPDDTEQTLDLEMAAAHRAGLGGVRKLRNLPHRGGIGGPCLVFPNQAQFHPIKYLVGVARCITRDGGLIHTHTSADRIEGGDLGHVYAGRHVVTADSVVVATNSPVNDRFAIHTKQSGYRTYVIGARIPAGSLPLALYWDTEDPCHYVRLQNAPSVVAPPPYDNAPEDDNPAGFDNVSQWDSPHEILIVGGEDHKVGQADDTQERYGRLESWARRHFPAMGDIEFEWSGQVMNTVDGLAFIGRNPLDSPNVFICTGDNGSGMTHGTVAGILLSDLILGRENPWEALYEPSRKSLATLGEYLKQNVNTAAQFRDWLTPGNVESTAEIPLDSGAILRDGVSKIAVYRDGNGKLFKRSAVCPHLGGIVRWNPEAKSWDCPCHGSRFNRFGEAIMGPANTPLAHLDPEL
jgi:glycine/D-amino acid oxidase-like deaminating enzyme/nitrite reductase/ring-hydroxylating ferredoxin subunit